MIKYLSKKTSVNRGMFYLAYMTSKFTMEREDKDRGITTDLNVLALRQHKHNFHTNSLARISSLAPTSLPMKYLEKANGLWDTPTLSYLVLPHPQPLSNFIGLTFLFLWMVGLFYQGPRGFCPHHKNLWRATSKLLSPDSPIKKAIIY